MSFRGGWAGAVGYQTAPTGVGWTAVTEVSVP